MQQLTHIPEHIAIIMDGNGRWAKAKGLPRTAGHVQGVETVRKITEACVRRGVKYLTLYTFSTENWNRPVEEIKALMDFHEEQRTLLRHRRYDAPACRNKGKDSEDD